MIRAGTGLSLSPEPRAAAQEAAGAALEAAGGAEAALVFATPHHAEQLPDLLAAAAASLGTEALVGATAHGVLAGGIDREDGPGVAVMALRGVPAELFLLGDLRGEEAAAGEEIASRLDGGPRAEDLVVVLPDPRGLDTRSLVLGLREALAPAQVVGAGAASPLDGQAAQWCGLRIESGGLAGLALRPAAPPRLGVTQACRPATELMTVTRTQGHWILELDGRPALDVYREVARGRLADELERAAAFVLVALPRDPDAPLRPGGYLVRHVVGFAPEQRALALPETLKPGDLLALARREPESAREDMKAMLGDLGAAAPAFGIYLDCCARGASLFGVPGLEAAYLDNALAGAPLAGMFGSFEIGPIGGATELLTYTGVLALIDGADPGRADAKVH